MMTVHYKTRGFVFKKEDRLEADRVFTVFTQDFGKIEIFAKAIRRIASKLKGGIEIFSFSEVSFIQGKNRKTLTDTVFIERCNHILESPEKIAICVAISGMLDSFIRGQESDERVWNLIIEFFKKLDIHRPIIDCRQWLYYYFFWNLISILGYEPEISKCAACNQVLNPHALYFSNKEGGTLCQACFVIKKDGVKIHSDIVKILRIMLKKDWVTLLRLKVDTHLEEDLKRVSDGYHAYLSEIYS